MLCFINKAQESILGYLFHPFSFIQRRQQQLRVLLIIMCFLLCAVLCTACEAQNIICLGVNTYVIQIHYIFRPPDLTLEHMNGKHL